MVNKLLTKKGSALISALFIMTLIAIAATAISYRLQSQIYQTKLIIQTDQLYLASQAVTFWTMDRLTAQQEPLGTQDDSGRVLDFPQKFKNIYPDVKLSGQVYDLQARVNLNNLRDEKYKVLVYGLLDNRLKPSVPATQRRNILDATIHWINDYRPERGQDLLLQYYLQQKTPYLPAYQPMHHISEFRLVRGVDAQIYQLLLPYITALPDITPININTASKMVLKSLGNGLNDTEVESILKKRGSFGFPDPAKAQKQLSKLYIPLEQITFDSAYFLCVAQASNESSSLKVYTVIKRTFDRNGEKLIASVISESINTF